MKNLQDFKDQVAREHRHKYRDYVHAAGIVHYDELFEMLERAAELYAKERGKEAFIAGYNQNGGDPLSREIHLNHYLDS